MDFRDVESILNALPRFTDDAAAAYQPGLERIQRLLVEMGRPQDDFDAVLVAGTNGKGSTASFVAAIGTAAGRRVGLHTSPHLFHISERMRVDGKAVPETWLIQAVARYEDLISDVRPSFFEFTVALSLRYFADESVDIAVVEVGMGGRLDATNILQPILSVITNIGLDHTDHLGTTIDAIAAEKAGIIKKNVPVVTAARADASRVIAAAAAENKAPFHHVNDEVDLNVTSFDLRGCRINARTPIRQYKDLVVGLPGRHQTMNAALALRAAELVYDGVRSNAVPVFEGMRNVRYLTGLRGRLEVFQDNPLIVADVAHNPDGIEAAVDHLESNGALKGRLHVLLGVMRDKDVDAMARRLAKAAAIVRPVEISSSRALSPAELAGRLQGWGIETGQPCTVEQGVHDFNASALHSDALLVTGSHFVVAQLPERGWAS